LFDKLIEMKLRTKLLDIACEGSLRYTVSAFVYHMCFQSQLGQTKVDFDNQGKNTPQCIAF
jgi:hypothetical protein